jgi:phosphatidylserine decarboxylase
LENERNEMLFETKIGKIKVVQIAGFLARRIKCFVKHDQKVEKGEEIGFITFGSQVALLLPDRFTPSVKAGERVVDGETILGYFKEKM